jgi:predicted amidohydrolase YtcJ
VIEGHTGFMIEPYSDEVPEGIPPTGQTSMPLEKFQSLVATIDSLGFQIYTHAIGDGGVRETLNAYENAREKNGVRNSRHRVEHIEIIHPDEFPRFRKLDVMASMQPIHAQPGEGESVWEIAVGKERLPNSFAWASMLSAGAKLVFSSDWPACLSVNPIRGLHVAVTRQNPQGIPAEGWIVDQKISIAEALRAYTKMGAYSSFEEDVKGQILPGYFADLIVLSQDLFTINSADTYKTKVVMTIFDGEVIFSPQINAD